MKLENNKTNKELRSGGTVSSEKVKEGGIKADGSVSSFRTKPLKEKIAYETTPTPEGYIKAIALMTYTGMLDIIFAGEVFLLPERRFKSLASRGYVEQYTGDKQPINKR